MSDEMLTRPGADAPRLFRVFGMQRSGNHAVIAWLRANLGAERNLFLNNCGFKSPLETFAQIEIAGQARRPARFRRNPQFEAQVGDVRDYGSVIVSYENKRAHQIKQRADYSAFGPCAWQSVFVIRSFLNWLASYALMRSAMSGAEPGVVTAAGMYDTIGQLATYRATLKSAHRQDAVAICYDDWVTNAAYREARLSALGIAVVHNEIGARTVYGKGSSVQDAAQRIDAASQVNRWQRLEEQGAFQACLAVAAQDAALMAQIKRAFPEDHAMVQSIAGQGARA